jgi:hypothetical protein
MQESTIYPSQGLRIWLQKSLISADNNKEGEGAKWPRSLMAVGEN